VFVFVFILNYVINVYMTIYTNRMSETNWAQIAETGRAGLESMAESQLRDIAKKEGIDDSLDLGEVISLVLEAANKKNASKEEKQEFIKKAGISTALTMIAKCPHPTGKWGIAVSVGTTFVAIAAVVAWYFV
jgi:hypothetical protein